MAAGSRFPRGGDDVELAAYDFFGDDTENDNLEPPSWWAALPDSFEQVTKSIRRGVRSVSMRRPKPTAQVGTIGSDSYQVQHWNTAMEANLDALRDAADRCLGEKTAAEAIGDVAAIAFADQQLKQIKVRQARLANAVWVRPDDLPSAHTLLQLGQLEPIHGSAVLHDLAAAQSDVRICRTDVEVQASATRCAPQRTTVSKESAEFKQHAADNDGGPNTETSLDPRENAAVMYVAQGGGRVLNSGSPQLFGASAAIASSHADPGSVIINPSATQGTSQDMGPVTCATTQDDSLESTMRRVRDELMASVASAGGKDHGKGHGKGHKGPPPPRGKGERKRNVTPLGRRFHWRGLSPERVQGTIFDGSSDRAAATDDEPALNLDALQHLFADDEVATASAASGGQHPMQEIRVFDSTRSQNVAIVLRGVFGRVPNLRDMEALATGLGEVEPSYAGAFAAHLRDADKLVLLATALPSAEEIPSLVKAPSERLRHIERLTLPLAHIPHASNRLHALRLSAQAASVHAVLLRRIDAVTSASQSLQRSGTLRCLLQTTARLGSWINSADLKSQPGFALSSALGKLRQFRAYRHDRELSLLHVVVLEAVGGHPSGVELLAAKLTEELQGLKAVAREDLKDLGCAVSDFAREAAWLTDEAEQLDGSCGLGGHRYPVLVRVRMRAIFNGALEGRSEALVGAWKNAVTELRNMLKFLAEDEGTSVEKSAQDLFATVQEFVREVQQAAHQIMEQPDRFQQTYAINVQQPSEVQQAAHQKIEQPEGFQQTGAVNVQQPSDSTSRRTELRPNQRARPKGRARSRGTAAPLRNVSPRRIVQQ